MRNIKLKSKNRHDQEIYCIIIIYNYQSITCVLLCSYRKTTYSHEFKDRKTDCHDTTESVKHQKLNQKECNHHVPHKIVNKNIFQFNLF